MRSDTQRLIVSIESALFFSRIGETIDVESYLTVSSWDEASLIMINSEFENTLISIGEDYRNSLRKINKKIFLRWNSLVKEIRPQVIPLVKNKIQEFDFLSNLPIQFTNNLYWIALSGVIEQELANIASPSILSEMLDLIIEGRYPVGWSGIYPVGKLVVY